MSIKGHKLPKLSVKKMLVPIMMKLLILYAGLCVAFFTVPAYAAIDILEFQNEQQEQQYRALIEEFRCPKCQNQNLAGSDSVISQDLKKKTYEMVIAGKTDTEIRTFMVKRYGDFITYQPPVRPSTYILWYLPPVLLFFSLVFWLCRTKRQSVMDAKRQDNDVIHSSKQKSHNQLNTDEQEKLNALLAEHDNNGK